MPFQVKDINSIINDIILNIVTNTEEITDANVGSVMRNIVEAISIELSDLYTSLQVIYDGSRVDTATSTDLDQIGAVVGITRVAGLKASGNVSFMRSQPSISDFSIASGSIISTQPNTGETVKRFIVDADTTFSSNIIDESHLFEDGIYDYSLNERFFDSITSISATVLTTPGTILSEGVDFNIINVTDNDLVNASTMLIVDDSETADYTESADATAEVLDNVEFREGSNSLKLGKSGTASNIASYEKVLGSTKDGVSKDYYKWIYIKDLATLNKISSIKILYGSGGSSANSYERTFLNSELAVGWQLLRFVNSLNSVVKTGLPNMSLINFEKISIVTNLVTDTLLSGDVLMDASFFAVNQKYTGQIIRFVHGATLPDDTTNFLVTYVPLSKEVICSSEDIGTSFNVSKNKIVFKVSSIANINSVNNYVAFAGGSDIEDDVTYRSRIKLASATQGKATVEALRQSVLAVSGVTSVTVDDLPLKSKTDEPHLFTAGIDEYKLSFEVAIDNANLVITGTASTIPTTFINGTDYVLDNKSQVIWQLAGTKPDDGTIFLVDYDYNWLGYVDIFASGNTAPLLASIVTNINTVIEDTRAAGVIVNLLEPTIISVDVTATISVQLGFILADVASEVQTAVFDYINGLGVGQDVFIAEIYRIIQDVPGVDNSSITVPVSDISITTGEVAKANTILIS